MRVLITGGAGFVGSNLVARCLEAGDEVRVLDDLSSGRPENLAAIRSDIEFMEGDICDPEVVSRAVANCEVVYHQAAMPSVPRSIERPVRTHAANASGSLNVLQAAREGGARRLVYAASSSAYGDTAVLPKVESMPANPLSPYALQKYVGERYCELYHSLYGLETVALRYFNVFGPHQDPKSNYAAVIPAFLSAIAAGEAPTVHGDGLQSRDFTFISDVVAANRAAADGPQESAGQVFNVGGGNRVTLLDLIREMAAVLGRDDVEPRFVEARAGDVRDSQADIGKAERLLGWRPQVPLREGLARTAEYLLASERP